MENSLGTKSDGVPVEIDIDRLVGAHAGIVANPGAGKSGLIRRLLEITHGRVQQIVLDPEDEFYTLREKYPYIIMGGENGDAPISMTTARDLAQTILRHGMSAIIQLNSLHAYQQEMFIARFIDGLMDAPRDLWHPALVVLDEAHRWAPQDGNVESSQPVRDLTSRGRKRGYTAVLATQRMAKIDKNVTGNVNNWFMGRVGQSTDRRVAADHLGFSPTSDQGRGLQSLPDYNFWGFGPAISRTPVCFKVSAPATTMLKTGQATVPTPPAPKEMREILAGLAKAIADEEAAKKASVVQSTGAGGSAILSTADQEAIRAEGHAEGLKEGKALGIDIGLNTALKLLTPAVRQIEAQRFDQTAPGLDIAPVPDMPASAPRAAPVAPPSAPAPARPATATPATGGHGKRSAAVSKIIETLNDMWPRPLHFMTAAKHAGIGLKSSQFKSYEPELRLCPEIEIMPDGRYRARRTIATGKDVLAIYQGKMMPAWWNIFTVIRSATGPLDRDTIIHHANISPTSSTGSAALRGLVEDFEIVEKTPDGRYQLAEAFR